MPHRPDDPRYPHLEFSREAPSADRRKRRGFGQAPPDRGGREHYGAQLLAATERVAAEQAQKRPPPAGITPHLVFRVPLAQKAPIDTVSDLLRQSGLIVVSVESDRAVVAFRDDADLVAFQDAIQQYRAGPRVNPQTGLQAASSRYDLLAFLEADAMRLWGRSDRVGPRLARDIGADGATIQPDSRYIVDVELWHPGTREGVQRGLAELQQVVDRQAGPDEQVLDTYRGSSLLLARVRLGGAKLDQLLDLDAVAAIELPPVATFEPTTAAQLTERDFPRPPRPPEDGPRVCILDSGIVSNHPLLAAHVGHEEAILTAGESPADSHGHGTMVGALAVFGDVRQCYEARRFASDVTLFSARVLNDQARFDDESLLINQLRRAIELFRSPPYNCRVFNISIGSDDAAIDTRTRHQNPQAEALDILARELEVLIVVSAGNHREAWAYDSDEADRVLQDFPALLFRPAARLNDFALAAIPLTVGATTLREVIAAPRPHRAGDLIRPIARSGEPAPVTRVGPGLMGAIKPELVHDGGGLVFDRFAMGRVRSDEGLAVMSFSHRPTERLFAYETGTSFAAPQVARLAALVEHRLRQELGTPPHPNLIRALIANAANQPSGASARLDAHRCIKACGYGLPDEDLALTSSPRRVTMFAQDSLAPDTFHIYRVPVPENFLQAAGTRSIRVALAFDPPVRGRRLDYLGVEMHMALIRGVTLDEVVERFGRIEAGEAAEKAFGSPQLVALQPGPGSRQGYQRKKSTLQAGTFTIKGGNPQRYGNEYWLVIVAERKWAPPEFDAQRYAVAVTLEAESPEVYVQVRQRIRSRARVRT